MIGPSLPPGFRKQEEKEEEKVQEENQVNRTEKRVYGAFPKPSDLVDIGEKRKIEETYSDDDDVIGPPRPNSIAFRELEERKTKLDLEAEEKEKEQWKSLREETQQPKKLQREEWMLSLPEGKSQLAVLGPRTFSKSGNVPKLDKSWTKVGGGDSKPDREEVEREEKLRLQRKREEITEEYMEQHHKQRGPSLVEIHEHAQQKKQEKEKSKESNKNAVGYVRPFDREKDMGRKQMSSTQRGNMIERAKDFSSNFVRGDRQ